MQAKEMKSEKMKSGMRRGEAERDFEWEGECKIFMLHITTSYPLSVGDTTVGVSGSSSVWEEQVLDLGDLQGTTTPPFLKHRKTTQSVFSVAAAPHREVSSLPSLGGLVLLLHAWRCPALSRALPTARHTLCSTAP